MRIVLLGAPGAGKGTQADNVVRALGLAHVASGDLFREVVRKGTEMGNLVKSYMDRGALVPDEMTIKMILERIAAPDCRNGFILDGFPRNLDQAKALDDALDTRGMSLDKIIYIRVAPTELENRLGGRWICRNCQTPYHIVNFPPKVAGKCDKCGGDVYQRDDDRAETVKKRIQVYFKQTAPLIDYYREAGKIVEINGEQQIDMVGRDIIMSLERGGFN
ncbi:MAG: adenylate kinase [Dehalococcoidia bacterium]|nr:adenylate kinase [Dehalococcoidia bacterium]